jgi:hypothetical protein
MRNKQLILRKFFELANFINVQKAMLSDNRPREEFAAQIEKVENKLKEIEVLINTEHESF